MAWIFIILSILLIVTLLIFLIGITNSVKDDVNCSWLFGLVWIMIVSSMCIGIFSVHIRNKTIPNAIEVYRGNTDMKIKYTIVNNDTIECDTTVVWKNKLK